MKKILSAVIAAAMLIPTLPVGAVENNTIYISPNGSDLGDGTADSPYKTFFRAELSVEYLRKKGVAGNIDIVLQSGEHYIDRTLVLDNDFDNITIKGENGAVVTGGASISDVTAVSDTDAIYEKLPESARANIKCVDLSDYFKTMKDAPEHLVQGVSDTDYVVSYNNEMMTLARYPNEEDEILGGFMQPASIIEAGTAGKVSSFSFTYDAEAHPNIANWSNADEIFFEGYGDVLWKYQKVRLASIDTSTHTITSAETKLYSELAEPNENPIINSGAEFYFSNIPEELDVPGEYYIDRENKKLYFYPDEEGGTVKISRGSHDLVKVIGAKNITFENICFENTSGSGFEIKYSDNVVIDDCEIRNVGKRAVEISYSKNTGVKNSLIKDVGQGGVLLGDVNRYSLAKSSNFVQNCEIVDYSRIKPTYSPAVADFGVSDVIKNNTIHESFHQAIALSGNDCEVSYNDIYDVVKGAADAGAIYMYRTPYARGNVIEYNYLHDISYTERTPGMENYAIYFDGWASGQTVRNNLFHDVRNGLFINCGGYFNINQNIFSKIENTAVTVGYNGGEATGSYWYSYTRMSKDKEVWEAKYPALTNICDDAYGLFTDIYFDKNIYNNDANLKDNVTAGTPGIAYSKGWPQITNDSKNSTDIFADSANGNFTFKTPINGLNGFDISECGVQTAS